MARKQLKKPCPSCGELMYYTSLNCVNCKTLGVKKWEVDWSKRKRENSSSYVWGRNLFSWQARCRDWHWVSYCVLKKAGIAWRKIKETSGRSIGDKGYYMISKSIMTPEEIDLCNKNNLWIGSSRGRKHGVFEHRLIAAKKYGSLPSGLVVRHLNGNKRDNSPDNLVLGTQSENTSDHQTAYRQMMYWRERALKAEGKSLMDEILKAK